MTHSIQFEKMIHRPLQNMLPTFNICYLIYNAESETMLMDSINLKCVGNYWREQCWVFWIRNARRGKLASPASINLCGVACFLARLDGRTDGRSEVEVLDDCRHSPVTNASAASPSSFLFRRDVRFIIPRPRRWWIVLPPPPPLRGGGLMIRPYQQGRTAPPIIIKKKKTQGDRCAVALGGKTSFFLSQLQRDSETKADCHVIFI